MALYLYVVSVKANYKLGKRIIFVFHCVSWPVPLLICIAAILAGKLGDDCTKTTNWCWIKEECRIHNETNGTKVSDTPRYQTVFWMLLAGKFWEITSYILIIIIYARVYKHVHEQRKMVRVCGFNTFGFYIISEVDLKISIGHGHCSTYSLNGPLMPDYRR